MFNLKPTQGSLPDTIYIIKIWLENIWRPFSQDSLIQEDLKYQLITKEFALNTDYLPVCRSRNIVSRLKIEHLDENLSDGQEKVNLLQAKAKTVYPKNMNRLLNPFWLGS